MKLNQAVYDQLPSIGHKLVLFMYDNSLSQKYIADRLDIPESTLSSKIKMNQFKSGEYRDLIKIGIDFSVNLSTVNIKIYDDPILFVSKIMEIEPYLIKTNSRKMEVTIARQFCMYYYHVYLGYNQHDTGHKFNRNHATVHHAVERVNNTLINDKKYGPKFKQFLSELNIQI